MFTLQQDKTSARQNKASLSRNVLDVSVSLCERGGRIMRSRFFPLSDRQRLSKLNQWLDCTGTETLGGRGKGMFLDTTSDVPQARLALLRIISTGCCEPGDPT